MLKATIKKLLSSAGYTLYKKEFIPVSQESMTAGLRRLRQLKVIPDVIVDLGAAQGFWSEKALSVWPSSKYELVEPLIEQVALLNEFKVKHPNVNYHLAVAGEASGEIGFNVSTDLDGSGVYAEQGESLRNVPVITVDKIVRKSSGSILLKFDTHGYEVPILNGAKESLKRVSAIVMEVYGFKISPTCLIFHEMSSHLDQLGFKLVDIVDTMRRPGDQVFWQADAIYIRKDNPVLDKKSYA